MNIKEKMHSGELYYPGDEALMKEQLAYLDKLYDFNMTRPTEQELSLIHISLDIEEFPSILRIPVTLPVPRPFLLFHTLSPVTIIITSDIISKSASSNSISK